MFLLSNYFSDYRQSPLKLCGGALTDNNEHFRHNGYLVGGKRPLMADSEAFHSALYLTYKARVMLAYYAVAAGL